MENIIIIMYIRMWTVWEWHNFPTGTIGIVMRETKKIKSCSFFVSPSNISIANKWLQRIEFLLQMTDSRKFDDRNGNNMVN